MTDFKNISQAQLKKLAQLDDAKARQDEGMFLAEGVKVVEELLKSDWPIKTLLLIPEKRNTGKTRTSPAQKIPIYHLNRSQWEKSDRTGNRKASWRLPESNSNPNFPCG